MLFKTDKQMMDELAARVQSLRLQLNLTQQEVANKAGISRNTIKNIESGKGCSLSNFIKVSRVMGRAEDVELLFKKQVRPTERLALKRNSEPVRVRATSPRRK